MDSINIDIKIPDVDKNITSVKELRQNIAALKDKLVSLDAGTQEYNDTVQELQANTSKLNEVNSAAKTSLDALPGSYNAINAEMKELMDQYKSMAVLTDEDQQKQTALAEKINNLNNKLKEQDAAVGVFNRNVGNYSSAFEGLRQVMDVAKTGTEQLGTGLSSIGSIIATTTGQAQGMTNGFTALGAVFSSTAGIATSLFDSIDKVNIAYKLGSDVLLLFSTRKNAETAAEVANTTATKANAVATVASTTATKSADAATKAFNKTLLTNPITLIVVAVLALIANLDKLKDAYKSVKEWITGTDEELEKTIQTVQNSKKAWDDLNESIKKKDAAFERSVLISKAMGDSEVDIINKRLLHIEAIKKEIQALRIEQNIKIAEINARIRAGKATEEEITQRNILIGIRNEETKSYDELNVMIQDLKAQRTAATIKETAEAHKTAAEAAKNHAKATADVAKQQSDALKSTFTNISSEFETFADHLYNVTEETLKNIIKLQNIVNSQNISEAEDLNKRLNEYSDKYLVHFVENLKKERDEQKKNNEQRKQNLLDEQKDLNTRISAEQERIKNLKKTSNEYKVGAANIAYMKDQLSKVDLSLKTIDVDIANNNKNIDKLFNETISKIDKNKLIQLYGSVDDAGKSLDNTTNSLAKSYVAQQEEADKINDAYKLMNENVSNGIITNKEMANVMLQLANNYLKAGNSIETLDTETKQYITDLANTNAEAIIEQKTKEIANKLTEEQAKSLNGLKEQLTYISGTVEFKSVARLFGWDETFNNEIEVKQKEFHLRLLEERKKIIEEQLKNPLLSDEERENLQKTLDEITNDIEKTTKDIENLLQGIPTNTAKAIAGTLKTMSMIQTTFNATMAAAKQKSDRIKKDTSLTAEQQNKLIEEQQKQYNAAFEANKKIEYANTVINTAAAAMSAYKAMAGIPAVGPALAVIAAAAATATGIMQLKQIANTRPDDLSSSTTSSSSSSISTSTPTINVNDLINADRESENLNSDYLTEIQNTKKSDTRVYVVQSDINETDDAMKTQVKQSTF